MCHLGNHFCGYVTRELRSQSLSLKKRLGTFANQVPEPVLDLTFRRAAGTPAKNSNLTENFSKGSQSLVGMAGARGQPHAQGLDGNAPSQAEKRWKRKAIRHDPDVSVEMDQPFSKKSRKNPKTTPEFEDALKRKCPLSSLGLPASAQIAGFQLVAGKNFWIALRTIPAD